eukprot:Phypoly_transcript_16423.p1 GENE.Phypoly_transcript_16423~~Phypoly_transcript_16423.p1  ORF type:complete len:202 (+),score=38.29 Phypoly_transcript_16423:173-778(+)
MAANLNIVKLCCLGDGGVGKTSITIQLCSNHFVEMYDPTIEDSYRKQMVIDEQACMLEILDTAGQEELTALRDQWIRGAEGFIIVYSITSRTSFDQVTVFNNQILRVHDVESMPMIIVGNKSDLEELREVSALEGKELAKAQRASFLEASAKTRQNIEEIFATVVRAVRQKRDPKGQTDEVSLSKKLKAKALLRSKKCTIL